MKIKIPNEVKVLAYVQPFGYVEIPATVTENKCLKFHVVEETITLDGETVTLEVDNIIEDAEAHLNYQLTQTLILAEQNNKPIDRYVIKDMSLLCFVIKENHILAKFEWIDWCNYERTYTSREYNIYKIPGGTTFYAANWKPDFDF